MTRRSGPPDLIEAEIASTGDTWTVRIHNTEPGTWVVHARRHGDSLGVMRWRGTLSREAKRMYRLTPWHGPEARGSDWWELLVDYFGRSF